MTQLKIDLTPEFEKDIALFMQLRHLTSKTEAIQVAIKEALDRSQSPVDFNNWVGMGNQIPSKKIKDQMRIFGVSN